MRDDKLVSAGKVPGAEMLSGGNVISGAEILLDAIGMIREETVQEAKQNLRTQPLRIHNLRIKSGKWMKWCSIAACLCVICCAVMLLPQMRSKDAKKEESVSEGMDAYPYSDHRVLDYVGMDLPELKTADSTIIFHEITDIEQYRAFNLRSAEDSRPYYKTHDTVYHYLAKADSETKADSGVNASSAAREPSTAKEPDHFYLFEKDGAFENSPTFEAYQRAANEYEELKTLAGFLLDEENTPASVRGLAVYEKGAAALYTQLSEGPNGQITLLMGKDLDLIDENLTQFLKPMRKMLGTDQCSDILGQEAAVQYFYQQRTFKNETTEECYNYYVYFEMDEIQYLYQFSSNWCLPGQTLTAVHNPPHSLSYAVSQDKSREIFAEILEGIVDTLR